MKYIDAEKLITEIERRLSELPDNCIGHRHAYKNMLSFIESLEKEQPDKYETALEKARGWMPNVNQGGHAILIDIFPELGEGLDPRYGGRKREQPEVDLEKVINRYFNGWGEEEEYGGAVKPDCYSTTLEDCKSIARHFYELGKNSK